MTTTMAEPEWDQETRDLVLAHDQVPICPLCKMPTSICQDPERQFDWGATAVRCHVTTARLAAQKGMTEETNPQMGALLWQVHLRAPSEGAVGG